MYKPTKNPKKVPDSYVIEPHPFGDFIPESSKYLIIGTFPSFSSNLEFKFFYGGLSNPFWEYLGIIFNYKFKNAKDAPAINERKKFLEENAIGITDMLKVCSRKNKSSKDEDLYPIVFNDVLSIIEQIQSIDTLIFTSRTDGVGALGLFKSYLFTKDIKMPELTKRPDKILEGKFSYLGRNLLVLVPYSTSARVTTLNNIENDEVLEMYKYCLNYK